MKRSRFGDSQVLLTLKQAERGVAMAELCCQHGISDALRLSVNHSKTFAFK